MSCDFCQGVRKAGSAGCELDEGDGFHEVGDSDHVVCDREVDWRCGGAVGGFLGEERCTNSLVFEGVDDDLNTSH